MEEGDCDFREKKVVEDGPGVPADEATVDDFVYDHQLFDEMPVGVRQFYFVKVFPLENPNIDAMIKKAEGTIEKMNRDQILIAQKIRDRKMDRDGLNLTLRNMTYYNSCGINLKWHREKRDILHLSLDKLTFANNAYKGKPINSCLSGGEVDKQKLCFLMAHGCKSIADERKLLREVNASQGKDGGMTINELHAPIRNLIYQLSYNYWGRKKTDADIAREQAFLKDLKQQEIAMERAIADAVVGGKLWNTLGSRKAIQAELHALINSSDELKEKQLKVKAKIRKVEKELEKIETDITSLQNSLKDSHRRKDAAYNTILKLKKQYGEENARYYQYHSLTKKIEALAKKKDIAAVQELSQRQVEKFMHQWNDCQDVRNDYRKRIVPSLNSRCLGIDGRTITNQKPQVVYGRKVIELEALSKSRLKWLMKDAEDPFELLS